MERAGGGLPEPPALILGRTGHPHATTHPASGPGLRRGAVCYDPAMLTPLLIITTLIGAWCAFLAVKQKTPLWFCIGIDAVSGLAYGLLIFSFIAGPL